MRVTRLISARLSASSEATVNAMINTSSPGDGEVRWVAHTMKRWCTWVHR